VEKFKKFYIIHSILKGDGEGNQKTNWYGTLGFLKVIGVQEKTAFVFSGDTQSYRTNRGKTLEKFF